MIFISTTHVALAHAQMELDLVDFNRRGGAGSTLFKKCRPVGSESPNASHFYTNWKYLLTSNGRITRFETQMAAGGIGAIQYDIYETETTQEALDDMGLEFIPAESPPPPLP